MLDLKPDHDARAAKCFANVPRFIRLMLHADRRVLNNLSLTAPLSVRVKEAVISLQLTTLAQGPQKAGANIDRVRRKGRWEGIGGVGSETPTAPKTCIEGAFQRPTQKSKGVWVCPFCMSFADFL